MKTSDMYVERRNLLAEKAFAKIIAGMLIMSALMFFIGFAIRIQ